MKDIAIVYSSKCGHTKQYADWLKEEIDADVINVTSFAANRMVSYRLVIFACGVYGDKLSIMDFVKKNISAVPMQKTMVMAVSWYTNDSEEARQKLIADNYPDQFKHNNVPMYVINSGIDKKQISPADKVKLVAAKAMIDKKDGRSSDDINALAIIKGYADQTSKDNLASIKKGIDEFFNPPKKEPEFTAPPPKPAAPKPAESKPAEPVQKPAPAAENPADALSSSVEEAFKNLYAPKPKPAAPEPEPAAEAPAEPSAPVARFNENGEIVVSSIVEAIKTLNGEPAPKSKPAPITREPEPEPIPEPKAEPAAEVIPEPEPEPEPIPEPKAEPAAEVIPEPQPVHTESEPVQTAEPAKAKNSYMELFAKRRRSAAEAASAVREAAPAPVVKEPEPQIIPEPVVTAPKPTVSVPEPAADEFNFADFATEEKPEEYIPAPAANTSYDDDFGGYDFIADDKPKVSKRALNAVQDLAKAKEAAEKEAAKNAAAKSADTLAHEPDSLAEKNDILEKMKHDIEALAEESELTQNFEVEEAVSEPEIEVEHASAYEPAEESGDGLEAFAFTDSADYDLDAEFAEPPKLEDMDTPHSESRANFDLRKLQEEIEESIETNRAAKERMMARYGKKQKEAAHNPFAVQFEEDEDAKKSKKSKKQQQSPSEPKRLADPIDPDIFFSRTTAKNQEFNTGSMPEIKFKNQK